MRILICGINYAPELVGIGKFTSEMAEWFALQGHQIRVVTAPPYYPAWKVARGYRSWGYSYEVLGGVEVYRCPLWVKQHPSGWQRVIHLLSFMLSCLPVMLRQVLWRPDVVIVIEPPLVCLPIGLLTAKLSHAQCWLHIQDFEIETGFNLNLMPSSTWIRDLVLRGEGWLMGKCHLISTISEGMLAHLRLKGVATNRSVLFPNWVDTHQIYPLPKRDALKVALGFMPEDVIVLYAGTMANKQGLELLIRAAERLQALPNLYFVLAGEGARRSDLEQMAQSLQLQNLRFLPLHPVEQLNQLLNLADVHVLVQRPSVTNLVMPSKLTGMMASGRPVIATAPPESAIANIIETAGCGLLVTPESLEQLTNAIQQMVLDPQERERLGRNGRHYAELHLGKEVILNTMLRRLPQSITTAPAQTAKVGSTAK